LHLDSSALIAIVMGEPGFEGLLAKLRASAPVGLAAPALVETALVLSRRLGGNPEPLLSDLLAALEVQVIAFTREHAKLAADAFLRFGKGRHPASLNFGDCMVYAVAAAAGEPVLYVAGDFARTDLEGA
jgi:ribonuclease VapC